MSYPSEWRANEEGDGGTAVFMVDGLRHEFALSSFSEFESVGRMLDTAFNQGKSFAFDCVKSAVDRSIADARMRHAL